MAKSLKKFRYEFLELILQFLWRQWSALGAAGYGASGGQRIIDPEALLLFTCIIGRYEPRLFDEILEWLNVNGNFINVQRLKTIQKLEQFTCGKVLTAIAALPHKGAKTLKWKKLSVEKKYDSNEESLFYQKDGIPMKHFGKPNSHFQKHGLLRGKLELRSHTQPVRAKENTNLIFKLRALFGLSARCEILAYLLTHESGHPHEIARKTYYFHKTVQDALVEISKSGLVFVQTKGKEKHYWLRSEEWLQLLYENKKTPQWITWPPLFKAVEMIWMKLNEKSFMRMDALLQSSELRQLIKQVRPKIEKAGLAKVLSDERLHLGKEYIKIFQDDILSIMKLLKVM